MSADARVWKDAEWWCGGHDGACPNARESAPHRALELEDLLTELSKCVGYQLFWEPRRFQHQDGLVGYSYPRS